jgi:peptidoglycan/LPS O-acetylase OafA/YrhL
VALDGLRGVAALVVLLCHSLFASSTVLADAYQPGAPAPSGWLAWALVRTPLHVVWAGQEAVVVFFVLSGYVLTLMARRAAPAVLPRYYAGRFLRLYPPVWGAVVLAVVLRGVVARQPAAGATWWLDMHAVGLGGSALGHDTTLVAGAGSWAIDPALWSLRWEVVFSAALPAFVALAALRRLTLPVLASALAAIYLAGGDWLTFLPMFLVGACLAFRDDAVAGLRALLERGGGAGRAARAVLPLLALGALTANWWTGTAGGISRPHHAVDARLVPVAVTAGAALAVLLALAHPAWSRTLSRKPIRWAGARSYSIYLVHEPVVVALAFALGGRPSTVPFVLLGGACSLVAAEGFFRAVERPAHRLSRRVGRGRLSSSSARRAGGRTPPSARAPRGGPRPAPTQSPP